MRLIIEQVGRHMKVHKEPSASILGIHWEGIDRLGTLNQELQMMQTVFDTYYLRTR
jgi:hypothetical protein